MQTYISFILLLLIVGLVASVWRMRKGHAPGPAAGAMMQEMLDHDRRAAVEIVLEERAAAHDPEDRDGNLPELQDPRPRKVS